MRKIFCRSFLFIFLMLILFFTFFALKSNAEENISLISVSLKESTIYITEGESKQIEVIFNPENCTNKKIHWTSSNPEVVSVDENGVVTGLVPGGVYLTGITDDGGLKIYPSVNVKRLTHQVTFNCNGGYSIGPYTINHGATINRLETPIRNGYTFLGWYEDEALTKEFDINTPITNDITLYAKWIMVIKNVNADNTDFERPYYGYNVKNSFNYKIEKYDSIKLSFNGWAYNCDDVKEYKNCHYNENKYGIGKFVAVLCLKVDDEFYEDYRFDDSIKLTVNYYDWTLAELSEDKRTAWFYSTTYETSDGVNNAILINGNTFDKFKNRTIQDIQSKWNSNKLLYTKDDNIYDRAQSYVAPYDGGVVKQDYLDNCIRLANYYRYLCGNAELTRQTVQRDDLQKASVCQRLYCNQGHSLTHNLAPVFDRPEDMDEDFYNIAMVDAYKNHNIISDADFTDPIFQFFKESIFQYTAGHRMAILGGSVYGLDFGIGDNIVYGDSFASDSTYDKMENEFGAYPSPEKFPYQDYAPGSDFDIFLNMNYFRTLTLYEGKNIKGSIKNINTGEVTELTVNNENIEYVGSTIHIKSPKPSGYSDGDKYEIWVYGLYNKDGKNVTLTYEIDFVDKNEGLESNINFVSMDQSYIPRFERDNNTFEADLLWYLMGKKGYYQLENGSKKTLEIDSIKSYDLADKPNSTGFYNNKVYVNYKTAIPNNIKDPKNLLVDYYGFTVYTGNSGIFKNSNQDFVAKLGESVTIKYDYYNTDYNSQTWVKFRWIVKKSDGTLEEITDSDKYTINKNQLTVNNVTEDDYNSTYFFILKQNASSYCPRPSKIVKYTEPIIVPVQKIELSDSTLNLEIGDTRTLTVIITPENATNKDVTWTSSDETVAKVDNDGIVIALKSGEATITAKAGECQVTCKVTVKKPTISAQDVEITEKNIELNVGETKTLTAVVTPENADNCEVVWTSNDEKIATVDSNGKVTAVKAGETKILAHVGDLISACTVTVKEIVNPLKGNINYVTHIENIGWEDAKGQAWKKDGEMSGTSGRSFRLEAIKIRLTGNAAEQYDIYYQVHAQNIGWMDWAKNGESAGTAGYSYRLEGIRIKLVPKGSPAPGLISEPFREKGKEIKVTYSTHVQNIGDQAFVSNGAIAGTSGQSLRLESIRIKLENLPGGIEYVTHIQNIGWEDKNGEAWKKDGERSGTAGRSFRLEAIKIRLTGEAQEKYDIYYRVHAQNVGWMGWAKNGEEAGTAGHSFRLEGIQIVLVKKGQNPPAYNPPAAKTFAFYN